MPLIIDLKKKVAPPPKPVRPKPAKVDLPPVSVKDVPPPPPLIQEPVFYAAPAALKPEKHTGKAAGEISWDTLLQQSVNQPRMLWLLGICAVIGAIIAKIVGSVLLLVLILISVIITFIQRTRAGQSSLVTISKGGISIDDRTRYWREMKSFWIEYNPGGLKELSLEPARFGLPYLKIPIEDVDPVEIRAALIAYLPEKEHELSAVEVFLKNR